MSSAPGELVEEDKHIARSALLRLHWPEQGGVLWQSMPPVCPTDASDRPANSMTVLDTSDDLLEVLAGQKVNGLMVDFYTGESARLRRVEQTHKGGRQGAAVNQRPLPILFRLR